jgi:hypothetical protein
LKRSARLLEMIKIETEIARLQAAAKGEMDIQERIKIQAEIARLEAAAKGEMNERRRVETQAKNKEAEIQALRMECEEARARAKEHVQEILLYKKRLAEAESEIERPKFANVLYIVTYPVNILGL